MISFLLVLSATIEPKGMPLLQIADPGLRRQQYLQNFTRCIEQMSSIPEAAVLFVENSGCDLEDFREVANRAEAKIAAELISVEQNDHSRELGKGFGEFRMIDTAVEQSVLAKKADYLVKLTGRLGVQNLPTILRKLPLPLDICGDVHPYPGWSRGVIDSRLLIFSRTFYLQNVIGLYREMNDSAGEYAEHRLYQLVRRARDFKVLTQLPIEPQWIGASGSTGERYDSWKKQLLLPVKTLRRNLRRVAHRPDLRKIQQIG